MAAPMEDNEELVQEDYYAWLNVDRKASLEEINNAFRRLSKIYHPDKHHGDPEKKKAEIMFSKIKKAHEVLSDKHTRTIYDIYGEKGLECGMELVSKTKSPAEIIAEYERIQREREERRLQQRTNPRGTITIGIDATDVFDHYDLDPENESFIPYFEVSSMNLSQSVEAPLTLNDTVTFGGNIEAQNGNGNGNMLMVWKRLLSDKSWAELEMSSGNGFGCSLKGFRRLTNSMYGTVGTGLSMTSRGLRPGFSSMIVSQFGNVQGRLVWSAGMTTAMSTIIVYDSLKRHAVFTVQIGIPNSFVSLSYTHKFQEDDARVRGAVRVGVFSTILECGVEKKITEYSTLGATMLVGVPTGVTLRIKLSRGRQTFLFPIHLSDHLMPSAIFYGTAVPFMLYHAVKILIIKPYLQEQKKRDIEKKQEENSEIIHKKKMEAEAAIHLMQETVQRVIKEENEKSGLLIVKALYGKLSEKSQDGFVDGKYIDVAVPLQCLIKNSSLLIPEKNSKTGILGFYDPCLGEEKSLYIRYKFRNKLHHVTLGDCEPLKIPLKSAAVAVW
ncbi:dnaJ homolog subfamily C member 11 isoform X2 [Octopus bimaculoides]|uniref:dnaJ homolog subfamily C member 11 isoform X2 n=1 Tax=Octopus bimaculoides TaxID=37653 RepID=UPI00071CA276|nr:dnaJ homolog subfamily C member 11 isoform X2 [Octopus bimaculoides]|eukprot:XP_014784866.1 PREDICTED: dnaJ homolog subfamily C member 11-like isoform X2 [Octopus bimaculoides]